MKIKRYKKFIIGMLISGLIGGIIGGSSEKISKLDLSFVGNMSNLISKVLFVISIIIIIYLIINTIYIKSNYMKVDLDNVPKVISRKVSNVILLSTVLSIIGLIGYAVVINKSFDKGSFYLIIVPTIILIIAAFVLMTTMKYSNYLNPNRKMYLCENEAEKKHFDKLDDGEKWVIYNCSYATFNKMQKVYAAILVLIMVLSIFINVPIVACIMIGSIWIIQNLIYSFEARKYEKM
ncbi:DUF3169 family protein [Clostridium estertheticum]|uniref:DUF3169 family protein n=1 Tax=Clostridium estertheticum TaxID=238834 RepID=UPI001C7CEDD7|nr:DUF3169 family protein [Clostridium estertheticum]MBX4260842.1 DUF3169 family protein [Clostridium estertheticum]WLC71525.1 DUF3169 family protein [Clostridium estertheticum]